MTWVVVVLWLMGDQRLPTQTGGMLQGREVFLTEAACVAAIPGYKAAVLRDFGEPGVVACTAQRNPEVAAR